MEAASYSETSVTKTTTKQRHIPEGLQARRELISGRWAWGTF